MTEKFENRDETRIYNKNKFKLGLFGMNCSGALSLTREGFERSCPTLYAAVSLN